jgi:hypothetical protein
MLYSRPLAAHREIRNHIPNSTVPPWARFVDFLCLLIAIVSIVIAVSGGFRVRLGDFRIALTSPYRLFAWALVLGVVRHAIVRVSPIYRDIPSRIAAAWRRPEARAATTAFVSTRSAVLFVGYMAVFMVGYRGGAAPWKIDENEFINLQARHDTGWYLSVAIDGYADDPSRPDAQQNIVFFPAYPMLMRAAGRLLGGGALATLLGGTLVSFGAFGWALVYLFRFARDMLGDADQADQAMWLLAAYPFAIFYSAVYSEAVYLLAIVAACYHFRRSEYARAAVWGLLAGLDRAPGCFLSIVLGLMALGPWLPAWLVGGAPGDRANAPARKRELVQALASAAMPGVGVLLFSAYSWWLAGNPLAWEAGHAAWGRHYNGLGVLLAQRADYIWNAGLYAYTAEGGEDLVNVLGALFVIAAAWPVARRLGLPYAVLILINILPPLAAGGFMSAGRFSSVLFPAFVWLATVVPPRHRSGWVAAFMAGQAFCAVLFYTWRPLF